MAEESRHTGRVILALLDRYIDGIYKTTRAPGSFGPFGSVGSVINVVMCGALGIGGTYAVVAEGSPLPFFPLIALFLEIVFIRILVRVRRGDFVDR